MTAKKSTPQDTSSKATDTKAPTPKAKTPTIKSLQADLAVMQQQIDALQQERQQDISIHAHMMFSMLGQLFTQQAHHLSERLYGKSYYHLALATEETRNEQTLLLIKGDEGHYLIDKATGQHANDDVNYLIPDFLDTLEPEQRELQMMEVNLYHIRNQSE